MAVFNGTSGSDFVLGTSDDDIFDMLGGNDTVYASGGNDLVTLGDGTDTLRLDPASGTMTVTDFNPGEDVIHLSYSAWEREEGFIVPKDVTEILAIST